MTHPHTPVPPIGPQDSSPKNWNQVHQARKPRSCTAESLTSHAPFPLLLESNSKAKFAAPAVSTRKAARMTTTASALPIAEVAAVGPEIATVAVNCFLITLVGLAVGFVLLRVEAAVEGEE